MSRDKYIPTVVKRATKSSQEAHLEGVPEEAVVVSSVLEWRLVVKQSWRSWSHPKVR